MLETSETTGMEQNPCEAVLVNAVGLRNVADKCIEYDIEKIVMVSTDKAVNPTNIMGCTKTPGGNLCTVSWSCNRTRQA